MPLLNRKLFSAAALVLALFLTGQAAAEEVAPLDIRRKIHFKSAPNEELFKQKIFVDFVNSQKMSAAIGERLKIHGYTVVENADEAGVTFRISGGFGASGAGKAPIKADVGELLEKTISVQTPTSPDYKNSSINMTQIVGVSFATNAISVTDIFLWVSQQTGIAGRFNEALTGDPRGWCFYGEACTKFENKVHISVVGSGPGSGSWYVYQFVFSEKLVPEILIADALDKLLAPLFNRQKNNVPIANAGNDAK